MKLNKYLVIYRKYRGLVNGTKILMAVDEAEAERVTRHSDPEFHYVLEIRKIGS